ncbi:hypothetical protein NMR63_003290 [Vibrio cholerae]|uniref:ATP-binding protein n=1 Tax=Vibrio TaxID=662 RepID=UPI0002A3D26F|nr:MULTISPECIES: ATP-binding protein [Vibrio]EGQ8325046.1 hypothetical protein [Vibrio cholerae]EGR0612394.1 hypothetical protein [Vibrio cholerae]EJL6332695.1 hypothetical protein [Vibrio cholerae]EKF9796155.1 hypothetical protein [Vibrio cholerae]EKY30914.1 hypothetical protein OSU_3458 [Vibrio cholerae PS15]
MKFRKLKVKILSEGQWYGFEYEFLPGLNIIRGDNSSGKSTLVNSLIYSIGMEELIGSKGPSSLPYALRTHFELDDKEYINVESYTLVELENSKGEVKTFKRYISSKDKDSKLVQIIHGDYLTQNESGSFNSSPVYLHDPNSATNEEFGFFATFEKFLGLELPNIADNKGYNRKLYLQYIFAALLIEQKRGWTNYIANTPYFGVSNVVQKTVSYLLNLDTFDKERKLNELYSQRNRLTSQWAESASNIKLIASNAKLNVRGLSAKPELDFDKNLVLIGSGYDEFKPLTNLVVEALNELHKLSRDPIKNLKNEQPQLAENIEKAQNRISEILTLQKICGDEVRINKSKIGLYQESLSDIEEELERNRMTNKLNKFGADFDLPVAKNICATCHNPLDDSLVSPENTVMNMTLDENIKYLDNQKSMVKNLLAGLEKRLEKAKSDMLSLQTELREHTKILASLKRDIKSVETISEADVRKKLILEGRIDQLNVVDESVAFEKNVLEKLSGEYQTCQSQITSMTQYELSYSDKVKLDRFEEHFRNLATDFSYRSAKPKEIEVNRETLVPYLKGLELREINGAADIKADSSASDFVRLIWSYLISICRVSNEQNGNHLGILLFDEPAQHSMSLYSVNKLLKNMADLNNVQCIVAASFDQSEAAFEESTNGVKFNYLRLPSKLIKEL